jgi:hypothetical protein
MGIYNKINCIMRYTRSDSELQTAVSEVRNALDATGMTRQDMTGASGSVDETGLINLVNKTVSGDTGHVYGWDIYSLNDSLQSTYPVHIKILYTVGARRSSTAPVGHSLSLGFQVGSSYNVSGTFAIDGSSPLVTTPNVPSWQNATGTSDSGSILCLFDSSSFNLIYGSDFGQVGCTILNIERFFDSEGNYTAGGVYVNLIQAGGTSLVSTGATSVSIPSGSVGTSLITSYVDALIPSTLPKNFRGRETYGLIYPIYGIIGNPSRNMIIGSNQFDIHNSIPYNVYGTTDYYLHNGASGMGFAFHGYVPETNAYAGSET